MAFVAIANVVDVSPGAMKKVLLGDKELLVINLDGRFYTMDDRCVHMQGDLSAGTLTGNVVTCPRHGSQYDVRTGKVLRGPKIAFVKLQGKDMKVYETKVEGSAIMADIQSAA